MTPEDDQRTKLAAAHMLMALAVVTSAGILFQLAMRLPGIDTPSWNTWAALGFSVGITAGLLVGAWWLVPKELMALRVVGARVTRSIGLTTPQLPGVNDRQRAAVGLVLLLTFTILLDSAGTRLVTDVFSSNLPLIALHDDWRYLAIKDAPPISVVFMSLLSAPVAEEVFFRGLPLALLTLVWATPRLHRWQPLVSTGIVLVGVTAFAWHHEPSGALNIATAAWSGSLYIATAMLTRRLWIPVAAHFVHNLLVFAQWLDWWQM